MMQFLVPLLFPYRTHLEAEIVWFQEQLAQKQRRVDELQDALVAVKQPSMKIQYERKPDGKLVAVQPHGWDAYRAWRREHPEIEEQPQETINGTESA